MNDSVRFTQDTVKFNVGGKLYEVSLSSIERNPESMLARLTSDMWNDDPSKPIFIDRDGDIFAHVLNYLRYGSIELPSCIPKSMFERELDYYGVSFEEKIIEHSSSLGTMKFIKQRIRNAELHHDMLLIAANCYHQYMAGCTTTHVRNDGEINLKHNPHYYKENTAMSILNGYLEQFYGLRAFRLKKVFPSDLDFDLRVCELCYETEAEPGKVVR